MEDRSRTEVNGGEEKEEISLKKEKKNGKEGKRPFLRSFGMEAKIEK